MFFNTAKLLPTVALALSIFLYPLLSCTIPVKFVLPSLDTNWFLSMSLLASLALSLMVISLVLVILICLVSSPCHSSFPLQHFPGHLPHFSLSFWPLPIILHIPPNFCGLGFVFESFPFMLSMPSGGICWMTSQNVYFQLKPLFYLKSLTHLLQMFIMSFLKFFWTYLIDSAKMISHSMSVTCAGPILTAPYLQWLHILTPDKVLLRSNKAHFTFLILLPTALVLAHFAAPPGSPLSASEHARELLPQDFCTLFLVLSLSISSHPDASH